MHQLFVQVKKYQKVSEVLGYYYQGPPGINSSTLQSQGSGSANYGGCGVLVSWTLKLKHSSTTCLLYTSDAADDM
eukprot:7805745-Prorocentrum_lima.AAC.1